MEEIPNIIHIIWFGSIPKYEYLENIRKWKTFNPGFKVKLWTSSKSMSEEEMTGMRRFCQKHEIESIDIESDAYLGYKNIEAIKEFLQKAEIGLPRFAAASDILRLSILFQEGGHYFDTDITPLDTISDIKWRCTNGSYQLVGYEYWYGATNPRFQYCIMGSAPNNEIYGFACELYHEVHKKIIDSISDVAKTSMEAASYAVVTLTGAILSVASRAIKITPEFTIRSRINDDIVANGKLRDKVTIRFDRSYGKSVEGPTSIEMSENEIFKIAEYLFTKKTFLDLELAISWKKRREEKLLEDISLKFLGYSIGGAVDKFQLPEIEAKETFTITVTETKVRPANLLLDGLFGAGSTTEVGIGLFGFRDPNFSILALQSRRSSEKLELSYIDKEEARKVAFYNQSRTTRYTGTLSEQPYGDETYQISVQEAKDLMDSAEIYTSPLLPAQFYLKLKELMAGMVELPRTRDEFFTEEIKNLFRLAYEEPQIFGFTDKEKVEALSNLHHYQIGSMVIHICDYKLMVASNNQLKARNVGENDNLKMVSLCGIRPDGKKLIPADPRNNRTTNQAIMKETFKALFLAINEKEKHSLEPATLLLPAIGLGVWGGVGDAEIYWGAFFEALTELGEDKISNIDSIIVNPSGTVSDSIVVFTMQLTSVNEALQSKIKTNIEVDILHFADKAKSQNPEKNYYVVNASDPDVTLGGHVGEYVNNWPHTTTTEENFAACGTLLLTHPSIRQHKLVYGVSDDHSVKCAVNIPNPNRLASKPCAGAGVSLTMAAELPLTSKISWELQGQENITIPGTTISTDALKYKSVATEGFYRDSFSDGRGNDFRVFPIYDGKNEEEIKKNIRNTLFAAVIHAATLSQMTDFKQVTNAIDKIKQAGGASNQKMIAGTEISPQEKLFSAYFQKTCESLGIMTGRQNYKKMVGLRLTFLPQEVVDYVKTTKEIHTNYKNLILQKQKDLQSLDRSPSIFRAI